MALQNILMPDVGEGITQAEIVEWHVKSGDNVREDDVLAAVMTDKATIEIPAPADGTIKTISGEIGEMTAVGTIIITMESANETEEKLLETTTSDTSSKSSPLSLESNSEDINKQIAKTAYASKPTASPAVRKLATESGTNLLSVPATGRNGRVTKGDLLNFLEKSPSTPLQQTSGITETKVIGLRRVISERMQDAKTRIAHFTYVEEIDVTELERLRGHLNETRSNDQPKLTILPFLMKAMVSAIQSHPNLNAHYDDAEGILRQFEGVHIGIAAQTEKGLMVPVVRDTQTLDIWKLSTQVKQLADAAKTGTANRDNLTGSTITLSSLGAMGGIMATPVINSPEVAIIGVNKIVTKPIWKNGQFVPRQIMNLSSSFDHRVIDGFDAASFIQTIKIKIEHPATLFIQ